MIKPEVKNPSRERWYDFAKMTGIILSFAFLMGIRDEFTNIWLRTLIAGLAFGIHSLMFMLIAKRMSNSKGQ